MLPIDREVTVLAHAVSGVLGESFTKKTPQVEIVFEITTAEFAGERINWYGYLSDKTAERTMESLRYAGWRGKADELAGLHEYSWGEAPDVELVIAPDTYNGETTAKVRWVNSPGRGGQPLPAAKAKEISAKLKGVLAAVDQKLKGEGISVSAEKPPF
jgi:hypothetical protein